jgi:hypothetical protein
MTTTTQRLLAAAGLLALLLGTAPDKAEAGVVSGVIGGAVGAAVVAPSIPSGTTLDSHSIPSWCFRTASEAVFIRCARPFAHARLRKGGYGLTYSEELDALRDVHIPLLVKVWRDHKAASQ